MTRRIKRIRRCPVSENVATAWIVSTHAAPSYADNLKMLHTVLNYYDLFPVRVNSDVEPRLLHFLHEYVEGLRHTRFERYFRL